jgi:hypothetical protein
LEVDAMTTDIIPLWENQKFPVRLHKILGMLERQGKDSVACWNPDGKSFRIRAREEFVREYFFNQTKFKSFQRQLNIYCFQRIPAGDLKGSYYHNDFIKSSPVLCRCISRKRQQSENMTTSKTEGGINNTGISKVVYARSIDSCCRTEAAMKEGAPQNDLKSSHCDGSQSTPCGCTGPQEISKKGSIHFNSLCSAYRNATAAPASHTLVPTLQGPVSTELAPRSNEQRKELDMTELLQGAVLNLLNNDDASIESIDELPADGEPFEFLLNTEDSLQAFF